MDMSNETEISIDDLLSEVTPDIVAARSRGYTYKGNPLFAFSKTRQVAAEAMGVKICSPAFAQCSEQMAETGSYSGMLLDAIQIIWLCIETPPASFRACRKPQEASEKALQWWERYGADIGSSEYAELIEIYGSIISDLYTVSAETDSAGKGSGQSLGE
jgi:hypothetical protein